jgi:predicted short-subunit dehydrogenase-like oxidoreductase (DUF2520 family)
VVEAGGGDALFVLYGALFMCMNITTSKRKNGKSLSAQPGYFDSTSLVERKQNGFIPLSIHPVILF